MIKNKALLGILFFLSSISSLYSCSKDTNCENSKVKTARVVGYLFSDNFSKMNSIEFCKLTHLNIAFANPDKNGNVLFNEGDMDPVIKYARSVNPNIVISISLAGGVISQEQAANWSLLIDKPENRPSFIENIVNFVELHHLDGVDVDLEWSAVTAGYSGFVVELKKSLSERKKILTAALPNNSRFENITSEALNAFDFLNIMAYDSTGPWTPKNPGQHSSFDFAKEGIDFWHKLQNVPSTKLTLGVPFYGYNFMTENITSVNFAEIVERETYFSEQDQLGELFYNGRPTIARKVEYASEKTGGIMIWELGQDSFDEYSLLDVIHKKYTSLKFKTTGLCGN